MNDFLLEPSPPWMADALCPQVDGDLFFPEKGGTPAPAKRVCARCDVQTKCLEWALDKDERFGVWGGKSEPERKRMRRARRDQIQAAAA